MEWEDQGIVLSVRRHGETNAVLELFTAAQGRHMGLVYGGASRKLAPVLQLGNTVSARWRARLADHLGTYAVDLATPRAGRLMQDPFALAGLSAACAMCQILPEREAHPALYNAFEVLLDRFDDPEIWPALYVRWEMGLLQEQGFGLDLSRCVATGGRDDLIYVSPKSGGAVSRDAGAPYIDKLFALPPFLVGAQAGPPTPQDVLDGLRITGFFLERHLFGPTKGGLPKARLRLAEKLAAAQGKEGEAEGAGDNGPDPTGMGMS